MKLGQWFIYNKKRRLTKRIFVLLVVSLMLTTFFVALPKIVTWVKAAAVTHGVAVNNDIPTETGTKGTESNPFVILEIVPYEGYAEIGYLIDGCEPVDIDKLLIQGSLMTVAATSASTATNWSLRYRFDDEVGIPSDWTSENVVKTLYGYYEKVAVNSGTFNQDVDGKYIKVNANKGNIIWKSVFDMTSVAVAPNQILLAIGDRYYTSRTGTNCKKGYAYTYTNKNYFLKNVLGIMEENIKDYHVVVKTVEPDELNVNLGWIERADLINISPKSHIGNLPLIWELNNKAGKPADPNHATDFGKNDLSWEATLRIFKKVIVADDYAAIIFDWTVYTPKPVNTIKNVVPYQLDYNGKITTNTNGSEPGSLNNVYKLAMMMRTMDPEVYYNRFLNDYGGTVTPLVKDGSFTAQSGDAKNYWTQSTFMPTQKDGSKASKDNWITNAMWDAYKLNYNMECNVSVAGRVYTYNGDNSISQIFLTENVTDIKYAKELNTYVTVNGGVRNPATAIKYILSHPTAVEDNQKASLKILDIEPSKEYTLTAFAIRMMMPKYNGLIEIVQMTSAEFIGKIEDLNSTYDMIYLGMNCGGFKTTPKEVILGTTLLVPDYNEQALDGKIYLHVGDLITGNGHDVNWLPSGYNTDRLINLTRMPGNDITKIKSEALLNYIKAGYPIMVDSKLYDTGTNLTKALVDQTSNIYTFIDTQKLANANIINGADTEVDKKVQTYTKVQKPVLKLNESPVAYIGNSSGGVISIDNYINGVNINYRKLRFNYTIVSGDNNKRYTVNLYIDANADGRFADTELNMSKTGVAPNTALPFQKPLAWDYFGVIPWKLEIIDSSNPNVRDNQTGFSAVKRTNAQKETIRILQINQNDGNSAASTLNLQYNVSHNGLFKTFTENLNDFNITFETITIKNFEDKFLGTNKFDNTSEETRANTDKLCNNYEMLIFGFADTYGNISNTNGALSNVMYYIKNYKSVLFTHDVTSFNNNASNPTEYGYNFNKDYRDILGMDRFGVRSSALNHDFAKSPTGNSYYQIHGYTSYALKRIANSGQFLTFKNLTANGDDNVTTTTVKKLNKGQLTQYPYNIEDTISVATTHAQYYQLNMEDPEIVVWYTLSGGNNSYPLYDLSPKDASNNYYIYNKGNITYSGVGHSTVGGSEMEVKLFINTMIAAYKSTIQKPAVEILNQAAFNPNQKKYTIYLDSTIDTKTTVAFIPWDYNFLSQYLGVNVALPNGTKFVIRDESGNIMTTTFDSITSESESMIRLTNGNTYTIEYDNSNFNDATRRQILFTIENEKGLTEDCKVEFNVRVLFDLD